MEINNEVNPSLALKTPSRSETLIEILSVSFKLGLTSFGGPIAHLGYFHKEYIRKRQWLDEHGYANLVALCQFLPGPASSQVSISIGVIRGGLLGGLLAWIGFTLPSFIALVMFAIVMQGLDVSHAGWIHGLKIVAVAIVAQAIIGMGQKLAPDKTRATLAIIVASITLLWQTIFSQVLLIIAAGLIGLMMFRNKSTDSQIANISIPIRRSLAVVCLTIFFGLLLILPLLRQMLNNDWFSLFDSFYRSGSLVFGGGHVVLPLLAQEVVPTGWVSQADFLTGYGVTQAVPGPLFTFAAYLGAMTKGVLGASVATVAIFLPAFLLVIGTLPFWNSLRRSQQVQGALIGINAAVVGILLAALYNPLWTSAILQPVDFAFVSILFVMLVFWKLPPWIVVVTGIIGGMMISCI